MFKCPKCSEDELAVCIADLRATLICYAKDCDYGEEVSNDLGNYIWELVYEED